jgi:Protein of unknown function (DUF1838)
MQIQGTTKSTAEQRPSSRRRFLVGHLAALAGASVAGAAAASGAPGGAKGARPNAGIQLPTADPVASIRQFVRMFATTGGEICATCEGLIYGHEPGQVAERLIGWRSVLIIRVEQIARGKFRSEQREAMTYADLLTGKPLTQFVSPYTGETLIPVGYVSPHNRYVFDVDGAYQLADAAQPRRSPQPDWRTDDEDVWVTESRYNVFPSAISEAEFPRAYSGPVRKSVDVLTYRASANDFANEAFASVPAHITLMTDAPWPLWMMRGRAPGGVLWQGFGRKYASLSAVPAAMAAATEAVFPGFMRDPWAFPEFEYGTAAQLRRLRAAGKI